MMRRRSKHVSAAVTIHAQNSLCVCLPQSGRSSTKMRKELGWPILDLSGVEFSRLACPESANRVPPTDLYLLQWFTASLNAEIRRVTASDLNPFFPCDGFYGPRRLHLPARWPPQYRARRAEAAPSASARPVRDRASEVASPRASDYQRRVRRSTVTYYVLQITDRYSRVGQILPRVWRIGNMIAGKCR
jgi:hypothetical protein